LNGRIGDGGIAHPAGLIPESIRQNQNANIKLTFATGWAGDAP